MTLLYITILDLGIARSWSIYVYPNKRCNTSIELDDFSYMYQIRLALLRLTSYTLNHLAHTDVRYRVDRLIRSSPLRADERLRRYVSRDNTYPRFHDRLINRKGSIESMKLSLSKSPCHDYYTHHNVTTVILNANENVTSAGNKGKEPAWP